MSARAAWRFESLGFSSVYRYTAGKIDWLANGLPTEGQLASEPRIGALVAGVATSQLGQRVGDIDGDMGIVVVVNAQGVVLGELRGEAIHADPQARVEDVMELAPITYRPYIAVHDMAHHMAATGSRRVLVTDADGHLLGVLRVEDVERAHRADGANGPILATQEAWGEQRRPNEDLEVTKAMGDRIDETKGNVKEGIGKLTGNTEMESEGRTEHDTAKATREVKGAANQVIGSVKEGLGKVTGDDETRARGIADRIKGDAERAG